MVGGSRVMVAVVVMAAAAAAVVVAAVLGGRGHWWRRVGQAASGKRSGSPTHLADRETGSPGDGGCWRLYRVQDGDLVFALIEAHRRVKHLGGGQTLEGHTPVGAAHDPKA